MIIKALVENTSISEDFGTEHGLSLYIESKGKNFLIDVGASGLFLENATKLQVNIADVDFLIISHGHYDHGGGLRAFLKENSKAKVFLHPLAFGGYFSQRENGDMKYIGLEKELKESDRIVFTSQECLIDEGIHVFSNVRQREPLPVTNSNLFMEQNGLLVHDIFSHEQNVVIEEDGKTLLITGCAHKGIINIMEQFYSINGHMPDFVIGGFHLSGRAGNVSLESIERIAEYLLNTGAKFFTCHCTGIEPYKQLKEIMGENIDYIPGGSKIML